MPFDPELQARIDNLRARTGGVADESNALKIKLEKRRGQPGFAENTRELEAKISEMGGEPQENDNGDE
jgi:hypothetical protein